MLSLVLALSLPLIAYIASSPTAAQPSADEHDPCENIPREFVCPLSQYLMLSPVKTSAGQTYDSHFIQKVIKIQTDRNEAIIDPLTRCPLDLPIHLTRNEQIATEIEDWLNEGKCTPPPSPTSSTSTFCFGKNRKENSLPSFF